jgi:general stress protein CsbA
MAAFGLIAVGWLRIALEAVSCAGLPDGLKQPVNTAMVAVILIIFTLTLLVAWFAPPNTFDSLNYHMSRVAHWAQNYSVAHYPSGMELQNSYAPFAEYSILHFYILSGGDRLANFSEWFAMAGSVAGVSLAAALLGAALPGQLLAAVFAASLPMGIVQASSTMTDYVTGFWLVCLAVEFLALWHGREQSHWVVLFMSASAGLAAATKPTAFAFMLPFALAAPVILFRQVRFAKFASLVVLAIVIFAGINSGYLSRNIRTYGVPFDPDNTASFRNGMMNTGGLASNMMRNAGLQLHTPWPEVNYQITRLIIGVHFKLGLDVNDPRTTAQGEFIIGRLTTHEDVTFNPLHALLIGIVFVHPCSGHTFQQDVNDLSGAGYSGVRYSALYSNGRFSGVACFAIFSPYAPVVGTFIGLLFRPAYVGFGYRPYCVVFCVAGRINPRPLLPFVGQKPNGPAWSLLRGSKCISPASRNV